MKLPGEETYTIFISRPGSLSSVVNRVSSNRVILHDKVKLNSETPLMFWYIMDETKYMYLIVSQRPTTAGKLYQTKVESHIYGDYYNPDPVIGVPGTSTTAPCCLLSIADSKGKHNKDRSEDVIKVLENVKTIHFDQNTNCYAIEFNIPTDTQDIVESARNLPWCAKKENSVIAWSLQTIPKSYLIGSPYADKFFVTIEGKKAGSERSLVFNYGNVVHINTIFDICSKKYLDKNEKITSILPVSGTSVPVQDVSTYWEFQFGEIYGNDDRLKITTSGGSISYDDRKVVNGSVTFSDEYPTVFSRKEVLQLIRNPKVLYPENGVNNESFISKLRHELSENNVDKDLSSLVRISEFDGMKNIHQCYMKCLLPWRNGNKNFCCILTTTEDRADLIVSGKKFALEIEEDKDRLAEEHSEVKTEKIIPTYNYGKHFAVQFETILQAKVCASQFNADDYSYRTGAFYPGYGSTVYANFPYIASAGVINSLIRRNEQAMLKYVEVIFSDYGKVVNVVDFNEMKKRMNLPNVTNESDIEHIATLPKDVIINYLPREVLKSLRTVSKTTSGKLSNKKEISNINDAFYKKKLSQEFNNGVNIKTDLTNIEIETLYNLFKAVSPKGIIEDYIAIDEVMLLFVELGFVEKLEDYFTQENRARSRLNWIITKASKNVATKIFEKANLKEILSDDDKIYFARDCYTKEEFIMVCSLIFASRDEAVDFFISHDQEKSLLRCYHCGLISEEKLTIDLFNKLNPLGTNIKAFDYNERGELVNVKKMSIDLLLKYVDELVQNNRLSFSWISAILNVHGTKSIMMFDFNIVKQNPYLLRCALLYRPYGIEKYASGFKLDKETFQSNVIKELSINPNFMSKYIENEVRSSGKYPEMERRYVEKLFINMQEIINTTDEWMFVNFA